MPVPQYTKADMPQLPPPGAGTPNGTASTRNSSSGCCAGPVNAGRPTPGPPSFAEALEVALGVARSSLLAAHERELHKQPPSGGASGSASGTSKAYGAFSRQEPQEPPEWIIQQRSEFQKMKLGQEEMLSKLLEESQAVRRSLDTVCRAAVTPKPALFDLAGGQDDENDAAGDGFNNCNGNGHSNTNGNCKATKHGADKDEQDGKAGTATAAVDSVVASAWLPQIKPLGWSEQKMKLYLQEEVSNDKTLGRFLDGHVFNVICSVVILVNTVYTGFIVQWEVEHAEKHPGEGTAAPRGATEILDWVFLFVYTAEVVLKVYGWRSKFWIGRDWCWNWFDFGLVLISWPFMLLPKVMETVNPMVLRLARIFKMITKAMRILHVVAFFEELRVLVMAIGTSTLTFIWSMLLLQLVIFFFAIIILQGVAGYMQDTPPEDIDPRIREDMLMYWGSMGKAVLTEWQSVTGGGPWKRPSDVLYEVGSFYYWFFVSYIAIMAVALMKLLTGIFCQRAASAGARDRELAIWQNMRELFLKIDTDASGLISKDEYVTALQTKEAKDMLNLLHIDSEHAIKLFEVLDSSYDGQINIEEFIKGCAKYGGWAKNADMALLAVQLTEMNAQMLFFIEYVESVFGRAIADKARHRPQCKRVKNKVS